MKNNLLHWVKETYPINPTKIELLRSYTNDVFVLSSVDSKWILKVYGANWRTESELHFEIDLLQHLSDKGVLVANTIKANDGKRLKALSIERENRFAILFEYADGEKPQPPFTIGLYELFGQCVANMHNASDDFKSSYNRHKLDLDFLIHNPVELSKYLLEPVDRAFVEDFAQHISAQITKLDKQGLDFGVIHGDMTLDNLHITNNNAIYLYDFDSGGIGWRASDLQGWALLDSKAKEKGEAFRKGYMQIRPIQKTDLAVAPYITAAWEIWGLSPDLMKKFQEKGECEVKEYLNATLERLRQLNEQLNNFK